MSISQICRRVCLGLFFLESVFWIDFYLIVLCICVRICVCLMLFGIIILGFCLFIVNISSLLFRCCWIGLCCGDFIFWLFRYVSICVFLKYRVLVGFWFIGFVIRCNRRMFQMRMWFELLIRSWGICLVFFILILLYEFMVVVVWSWLLSCWSMSYVQGSRYFFF